MMYNQNNVSPILWTRVRVYLTSVCGHLPGSDWVALVYVGKESKIEREESGENKIIYERLIQSREEK